jgi:hypothetical protein
MPLAQESVQRRKFPLEVFARIVFQRFGDEFAVGAIVLHTLLDDRHGDIVDVVFSGLVVGFVIVLLNTRQIAVSFEVPGGVLWTLLALVAVAGIVTVVTVVRRKKSVR